MAVHVILNQPLKYELCEFVKNCTKGSNTKHFPYLPTHLPWLVKFPKLWAKNKKIDSL
jgi:hypothetical protein